MSETEGAGPPADRVRCPRCRTARLKVLKKLDRIEQLHGNYLLNLIRARRGDTIYHCVFCRLQFYDPRKPGRQAPKGATGQASAPEKTEPEPVRKFVVPGGAFRPQSTAQAARATPVVPPPPATPVRPLSSITGTNIGAGVTIRGSVHSAEDMYVDARVEGTLASQNHRIVIGPNANVKAGVRASELEVLGTLYGNSHIGGKMILRRGSKVVGDIKTSDIVIEDGAQVKGSVDLVPQQALPLA